MSRTSSETAFVLSTSRTHTLPFNVHVLHCESKKQDTKLLPITDIHSFCAGRLYGKFATNSYLNIPPHLKYVATLPCEISVFKKSQCSRRIEANCHVRLNQSNKLFLKICLVKYSLFNSLTKRCLHQPKKSHYQLYTSAVTK